MPKKYNHYISIVTYIYISIVFVIIGSLCACNKSKIQDLSFAGITIGSQFPDSLIQSSNFKLDHSWVPFYLGSVNFKFPSGYSGKIEVQAYLDNYSNDEVYEILLTDLSFSQLSSFYEMFLAKYGSPIVTVKRGEKSFYSLFQYAKRNIDEISKREEIGYGIEYVCLVEWMPTNSESVIQIFSFVDAYDTDNPIDIKSTFIRYINTDLKRNFFEKYIKDYSEKKARKELREREIERREYKERNKEVLEQDF